MNKNKKIPFHVPSVDGKELDSLRMPDSESWLSEGKRVDEFERLFLNYSGGRNARAVSSCTAALHVSCLLSGLKRGRRAIVPVYTFAASANAILYSGAEPVFVDSSGDNPNIGIKELETIEADGGLSALICVNIGGIPCELDKLSEYASSNRLKLIQDCSHSIESRFCGKPLGDYGDFACYSFHATKNITTSDGGMLVFQDKSQKVSIDRLIHHGMDSFGQARLSSEKPWDYDVVCLGYKYNMTDLQAAIGIVQLNKLKANYEKRERIYRLYTEILKGIPAVHIPDIDSNRRTSYHLFQIFIRSSNNPFIRDKILCRLYEKGVAGSVHFKPLHIHPFYRDLYHFKEDDFPNSMKFYRSSISLPIFPLLKDEDVIYVCECLKDILEELKV